MARLQRRKIPQKTHSQRYSTTAKPYITNPRTVFSTLRTHVLFVCYGSFFLTLSYMLNAAIFPDYVPCFDDIFLAGINSVKKHSQQAASIRQTQTSCSTLLEFLTLGCSSRTCNIHLFLVVHAELEFRLLLSSLLLLGFAAGERPRGFSEALLLGLRHRRRRRK